MGCNGAGEQCVLKMDALSRPPAEPCRYPNSLGLGCISRLAFGTLVATLTKLRPAFCKNGTSRARFTPEVEQMARCTAPVRGHRSAAAAARCPACSGRSRGYGSYSYSPSYTPSYSSSSSSGGSGTSGGTSARGRSGSSRPRWSPATSVVVYTPAQVRSLTPIRESFEKRTAIPDLRDVFLCHAWDDRQGGAKDLHDLLVMSGVSVWFSEKDILLGAPFLREIDKGLAKSRVGIVLVTPAFLKRVEAAGIADKELSVLLARDLLVPIMHGTTYDALRDVSPLLGSRNGLDTAEDTMEDIAIKISELVTPETRVESEPAFVG